jgi:3-phosphoshikimate 1-carboxyvinyltransferase
MPTLPDHPVQLVLERLPDAAVRIPGTKSYTNRALVAAALAKGESRIRNASASDDARYLVDSLVQIGVPVSERPQAREIVVAGAGGAFPRLGGPLFLGNAGTAMRFLLALASTGRGRVVLDGSPRMLQRPIQDLVDALNALGGRARCVKGNGCPPVEVDASGLMGGRAVLRGGVSSQFVSAILLAAPAARGPVTLEIDGELTSKTYVDMTLSTMRAFGAQVAAEGYRRFVVDPARPYRPADYRVEPDAAGANYAFAMAAVTGGRVRVYGLGRDSAQGELRFTGLLREMGCDVAQGADWTEVRGPRGGAALRGIDADLNALPDSVQTLAVLALFAEGPTTIRNVPNLRVKETDRLAALVKELGRLGAAVEERPDGLVVTPAKAYRPATIETYDDHRMVMSLALAAVRVPGTVLLNPACVSKSFPEFFDMLRSLGVSCERPSARSVPAGGGAKP